MNAMRTLAAALVLAVATMAPRPLAAADLSQAIPPGAHLFVLAKHNPERDYQTDYVADVWKTFQEERIGPRLLEIVTSRMPEDDLKKATEVWEELCDAVGDVDFSAVAQADQFLMFQVMNGPVNQSTFAVVLSESDAEEFERGIVNLMELVSRRTGGKVPIAVDEAEEATITSFDLPRDVPLRPSVARHGDVVLISTSDAMIRTAVAMLNDDSPDTKYDDPRVVEALKALPEPEDAFVFFDGKLMFDRLRGLPDFIRQQDPNNEDAARFAGVFNAAIDEFAIIDFEATVEYTEGYQNRTAVLGRLTPDANEHMLGRAIMGQKAFDDWQSWIPAEATGYSLSTGVNLHEIYAGIYEFVEREFPEAQEGLDKFAAIQDQIGVHLDEDILQSFSGESVSVSFPSGDDAAAETLSVTAMKCSNPDKIRELLHRAVDNLKEIPFLQAQQLDLVDAEGLEGFEELKMAAFAMAKAQPVIGFDDGWMIIGSKPAAVEKFLAVRRGEAENIASAESFERFNLGVDGPVAQVSYTDIGAGIRKAADVIDQVAAMAPMFLGMAAQQAGPEQLKPVQELIGLLPSIAKVVRKCDFVEQKLTITREGPIPNSYLRESVTLVRAPGESVATATP
ncbi:MAG: hypothetical protein CMJ58_17185 [Planctomycetaceae bacterium]|nr:hypothetical protein [Planctomycetaceae bacterium]